jgi:hypothetical protein
MLVITRVVIHCKYIRSSTGAKAIKMSMNFLSMPDANCVCSFAGLGCERQGGGEREGRGGSVICQGRGRGKLPRHISASLSLILCMGVGVSLSLSLSHRSNILLHQGSPVAVGPGFEQLFQVAD